MEAVIAAKGDQLHINAHDFGMRCLMSSPHTFGHVVNIEFATNKHGEPHKFDEITFSFSLILLFTYFCIYLSEAQFL